MKFPLRGQIRCGHTRSKKINVQLLKPNYGRRLVGEVFPTSEGHMRLKLHPNGIAAYVLPDQATRIPILSTAEANQIRKEMQLQSSSVGAEETQQATKARQIIPPTSSNSKLQNLLDSLDFPVRNGSLATGSTPISSASTNHDNSAQTAGSASASESKSKKFDWQNDIIEDIINK